MGNKQNQPKFRFKMAMLTILFLWNALSCKDLYPQLPLFFILKSALACKDLYPQLRLFFILKSNLWISFMELPKTLDWMYKLTDDKPIVVVTHGDELPISERIQFRIHLGELLGISPVTQIFDIPDDQALSTKISMAKMLRYSLELADRNLPFKKKDFNFRKMLMILLTVAILLSGIVIMKVKNRAFAPRCPEIHVKWHKIRHIW